jgi:hypothetical protein
MTQSPHDPKPNDEYEKNINVTPFKVLLPMAGLMLGQKYH